MSHTLDMWDPAATPDTHSHSSAYSASSATSVPSTSHTNSAGGFNPAYVSYRPQLPHIVVPSEMLPASPGHKDSNHLSEGAVVGLIVGAIVVVFISAAAILWRHRDRSSTLNRDLEDKSDASDLPPPYEATTCLQLAIVTPYTNYVPRTHGRSPISNTVPSTFHRIQEHHAISDPFADPLPLQRNDALHDVHGLDSDYIEMKDTASFVASGA